MTKRNLFEELHKGIEEIQAHKEGKITLRAHAFKEKQKLSINAELIRNTRENLHLSRAVFALRLRVPLRTLEKWEQGITTPNDQAAALILMTRKYPDTLNRLDNI
jgi:putative transcriptional regulator